MLPDLNNRLNSDHEISGMYLKLQESQTLFYDGLSLCNTERSLAIKLVKYEVAKRANEKSQWPPCPFVPD